MNALLKSLFRDESGQAQAEYGLVIAVVAIALMATIVIFRDKLAALFGRMGTAMDALAN